MKLSVVISAHNGEKTIEECLKSVTRIADEIIVLDNSSTDNTALIAKKYTEKIFKQKNNPLAIDLLKNLGFEKANGDWVLCVDQDEYIEKDLEEEILKKIKEESMFNGFFIPRKNYIFGRWIKYAGWYPDNQLRLFRKGKGKYEEKHVHEQIKIVGEAGKLTNHIIHNNYDNIAQFLEKTTVYAKNEAKDKIDKGYLFSYADAIRFPLSEFLSRFFARKGYKDGFFGLMLSLLMAFYHFLIFAYIWEENKFKQLEEKEFIPEFEKEVEKAGKEFKHWFYKNEKLKTNSFLKKIYLKLRKK
jgi:glycosyltransferase involved in cell wall biosynthesis